MPSNSESSQSGAQAGEVSLGLGRRERWALIGLLVLAFAFRMWNVQAMGDNPRYNDPVMDAAYHLEWAEAIAAGESFQEGAYFRAPLYPYFVAAGLKVSGGSLFFVRLLQSLLGTLGVWLVWDIGRRHLGRAAGWWAGAFAATFWVSIYFDGELLIPTLYIPLLLLGLRAALRLPARDYSPKACLFAGVWFGLAAIARPNVLLFMPILFFWVLLRSQSRQWVAAGALTMGTLLPILPVTVRNMVTSGEPVLIATQAGVNFWIGNNPESDGVSAIVPGTRAGWWEGYEDSRRLARMEAGRELTDSGISQHYSKKAWRWLFSEPGDAVQHMLWKVRLFLTDWELSNNQEIRFTSRRFNPLSHFSLSFGLLLGLAGVGLFSVGRQKLRELMPLWSFVLIYSLSVVAFFVCSRFRLPIVPGLMLFAGFGAARITGWSKARVWPRVGVAAVGALAIWFASSRLPSALLTGDSVGLLGLGNYALEAGDLDEAERLYQEGLAHSDRNKHLRLAWGILLERRGQKEAARNWMYDSLALFDSYPEMRERLCQLEIELGQPGKALTLADQGLAIGPAQVGLLYQSGRALFELGQAAESVQRFDSVLALKPTDFYAHFSKGVVLLSMGERGAAKAAFEKANGLREQGTANVQAALDGYLSELGGG